MFGSINCKNRFGETVMNIEVSEDVKLTLDEIKWLESVCRKQRKRLKSNSGGSNKCNRTIDMFINYDLGEKK